MAVYPDGPSGIGRVLDISFRLYRASFGKSTLLALIAVFLVIAPAVLSFVVTFRSVGTPDAGSGALVTGILSVVCSIASLGVYLGIIHQVDAAGRDAPDAAIGDAVAVGFKRLLPMIWTAIVWYLALAGSAIPAIAAAALLMDVSPMAGALATAVLALLPLAVLVYLMFAFVLTVTDRESGLKAVRHSYALVKGNWWRVLLIVTVIMIIYMIISGVFAAVGGFLVGLVAVGNAQIQMMLSLGGTYLLMLLFQGLLTPYMFAGLLATLNDLRMRKEGGDLEARLAGDVEAEAAVT
ncbi:hypothetical protein H0Z60_14190 [Ectothiorhodospiraceae bacterium WFHF3C12]|nr:hypothetical protein [Ectothiorhodospiraceae bacterium WFHF3C12]